MVSEVDALYAETRAETGLSSMSPAVRAALGKVERHRLVPASQVPLAYRNHPLPIGSGQTISQPYIVALSTDLLKADSNSVVLDVGTGSGYQAAVLAEMGYRNIEVKIGDGYRGWPEKAPFDGIVVTAAAPRVLPALVEQLKPGGRMVIPVGGGDIQYLKLVTKRADGGYDERNVLPVRFVPLVPGK